MISLHLSGWLVIQKRSRLVEMYFSRFYISLQWVVKPEPSLDDIVKLDPLIHDTTESVLLTSSKSNRFICSWRRFVVLLKHDNLYVIKLHGTVLLITYVSITRLICNLVNVYIITRWIALDIVGCGLWCKAAVSYWLITCLWKMYMQSIIECLHGLNSLHSQGTSYGQ